MRRTSTYDSRFTIHYSPSMFVFYFFAAVVAFLGILSFRGGSRFASYVRRESVEVLPDYTPFASIIVPGRGLDEGLRENLKALLSQNYSEYEVVFVTDRADDPSLKIFEEIADSLTVPTRTVIAGHATTSGQKVHNLILAVAEIDARSEVLVFADTDARPGSDWLRALIAPLQNANVGATTGYRWFIAAEGSLAAHLRSVWNASIASALGEAKEKNFCWGGATAIRRETFEQLGIIGNWKGTISDDFTLTRVLQKAKLPIHFVPRCLTPSLGDCSFREFFEFTTRQLKITRVYASHLWKIVLFSSLLFSLVFFGGLFLVLVRAALGQPFLISLLLLVLIFLLGVAKSWVRLRAVSRLFPSYHKEFKASLLPHLLLWPVASLLFLWNALAAAFSRRIRWRGIVYQLNSPTEAVIISRE